VSVDVRWAWLFLDTPAGDGPAAEAFWATATRTTPSPRRGEQGEFATLLPRAGGAWVKVQRVGDTTPGVHLDLDVADAAAAADLAESLGAGRKGRIGNTVVLMRSPGGFSFCLTTWVGERGQVRAGEPDLLDQVCLDVPAGRFDAEVAFWAALTGWAAAPGAAAELTPLARPDGIPVRILCQRTGDPGGPVTGHPDLACADRAATTAAHVAAGAVVADVRDHWTVLRDPVGRVYCLTDRDPGTGVRGGRSRPPR
jgi:hypothetical protein